MEDFVSLSDEQPTRVNTISRANSKAINFFICLSFIYVKQEHLVLTKKLD